MAGSFLHIIGSSEEESDESGDDVSSGSSDGEDGGSSCGGEDGGSSDDGEDGISSDDGGHLDHRSKRRRYLGTYWW